MTQSIRHDQLSNTLVRRGRGAMTATRAGSDVRAFATLILSGLLVLLTGAVWMQLT